MKIAFAGVASTGKTTLSRRVASELFMPHVPEQVENAYHWGNSNGYPISTPDPRKFTDLDKVNIERGMFAMQRIAENEKSTILDNFVADSAQLMQMMYLLYFCVERMPLTDAQKLYDEGMAHMLTYDKVFYLPHVPNIIPIEDNGYRITNPLMLMAQDAILRHLIDEARKRGACIETITTTGLQERVEYVRKSLSYLFWTASSKLPPTLGVPWIKAHCAEFPTIMYGAERDAHHGE